MTINSFTLTFLPFCYTLDLPPMNSFQDDEDERANRSSVGTPVYEKFNPLLHSEVNGEAPKLLTVEFIKKYIHFVKDKYKPLLTDEAEREM